MAYVQDGFKNRSASADFGLSVVISWGQLASLFLS